MACPRGTEPHTSSRASDQRRLVGQVRAQGMQAFAAWRTVAANPPVARDQAASQPSACNYVTSSRRLNVEHLLG
eukprot:1685820-Amphidinium_carterae.3